MRSNMERTLEHLDYTDELEGSLEGYPMRSQMSPNQLQTLGEEKKKIF